MTSQAVPSTAFSLPASEPDTSRIVGVEGAEWQNDFAWARCFAARDDLLGHDSCGGHVLFPGRFNLCPTPEYRAVP